MQDLLEVREMNLADTELFDQYWVNATNEHLLGMGVDLAKRPAPQRMSNWAKSQIVLPYPEKVSYYLTWLIDGQASGHTNVNQIIFGQEAFMHLHMWQTAHRQKGSGAILVQKSLPFYFEQLQLQVLYCEPYAHNPAPNKTLAKVGFSFVKQHRCIPGSINFEQEVNRWRMDRDEYLRKRCEVVAD